MGKHILGCSLLSYASWCKHVVRPEIGPLSARHISDSSVTNLQVRFTGLEWFGLCRNVQFLNCCSGNTFLKARENLLCLFSPFSPSNQFLHILLSSYEDFNRFWQITGHQDNIGSHTSGSKKQMHRNCLRQQLGNLFGISERTLKRHIKESLDLWKV